MPFQAYLRRLPRTPRAGGCAAQLMLSRWCGASGADRWPSYRPVVKEKSTCQQGNGIHGPFRDLQVPLHPNRGMKHTYDVTVNLVRRDSGVFAMRGMGSQIHPSRQHVRCMHLAHVWYEPGRRSWSAISGRFSLII